MITTTCQADDGHQYEFSLATLGHGGQGTVHTGRRRADRRAVAIKRIVGGAMRGPDANRELQIALKLGQQAPGHLLAPLTWSVAGDDLLLVMPLADRSLADELAGLRYGLAEESQLVVLRDITSGLSELQTAGIVHRDLKPGNVLLYDGRWRLADFGMSRDLDARTATNTFRYGGTMPYLAPERWRGQPATHKSDLYALGCIAHELATGSRPFLGVEPAELQDQHLHAPPSDTPASPALARLILRLLDKDPARRPQDADAVLAALPGANGLPGGLAEAALKLAQRRRRQTVEQSQMASGVEARAAERRQALADLEDICASAAGRMRQDLPDLRWDNHGDVQRFHFDGIHLDLVLWMQTMPSGNEDLILAGEVSAVANHGHQRLANLICEADGDRQHWYLDTFVRHPLARTSDLRPTGLRWDDFIQHYDAVRQLGEHHTWQRRRKTLSADLILAILIDLLTEEAQA
ncbi:serine/threonine-protein kinase [Flindersiella endophytica]